MTARRETIRLAEQLISQGRYERAIKTYEEMLKADPHNTTFLNAVGDLHVRLGDGRTAAPFFLRAAESFSRSGFRKKAIAVLRKAHRQIPNDPEIVYLLSELHRKEGLEGEAKQLMMDLARFFLQTNKHAQARKTYERILEIDSRYIPALLKISELAAAEGDTQTEFEAYHAVGTELANTGRIKEAIKLITQAHEADPSMVRITKLLAELLHRNGESDQAKKLFEKLCDDATDDADSIAALGEIALESGDEENAGRLFHQAQSVNSQNERVLLLGGRIAAGRKDTETALHYYEPLVNQVLSGGSGGPVIAALEALAQTVPEYIPTLRKLDSIYTKVGDRGRLTSTLERLATALEREGELTEAIDIAERIRGLEPDKLAHKNRLERLHGQAQGSVMFEDTDSKESEVVPLAIEIDDAGGNGMSEPDSNPEIKRILLEAYVFLRYGLRNKAKERLSKGLNILADDPVLHERLAIIYQEDGDHQSALDSFVKASELWRGRDKAEKAEQLASKINEIRVSLGEKVKAEPSAIEIPVGVEPEIVSEEIQAEELSDRLEEVKYYLDQRFLGAAHRLLTGLKSQYPGQPEVQKLWESLSSEVSVELDSTQVGKELDSFFEELEQEVELPESSPAPEKIAEPIKKELEDELYALHSVIESRRSAMTEEPKKVDAERILSHLRAEAVAASEEENMRIHFELGTAYMESGLIEEAIVEFQMAAEDPLLHQKACLQLGICFRNRLIPDTAIEWLQKGLTAGGNEEIMADTLLQLALIFKAQGKSELLKSAKDQLRSLAPDHPGLGELDSNNNISF